MADARFSSPLKGSDDPAKPAVMDPDMRPHCCSKAAQKACWHMLDMFSSIAETLH